MKKPAEAGYILLVVTHDYEFLNRTCKGYLEIDAGIEVL